MIEPIDVTELLFELMAMHTHEEVGQVLLLECLAYPRLKMQITQSREKCEKTFILDGATYAGDDFEAVARAVNRAYPLAGAETPTVQ